MRSKVSVFLIAGFVVSLFILTALVQAEEQKKANLIVEVHLYYDLLPGIDQQAYQEWAKKAIGLVMQSPGLIEFRAHRNLLGSPFVRSTSVWQTLNDWANFAQSEKWEKIAADLRNSFAVNIKVEIWGPSPIVPEPLRPKK
ncbi:MAG: antibiotic biosynthesis monooxygenase [Candidatus Aminicenantaceae bacterium]